MHTNQAVRDDDTLVRLPDHSVYDLATLCRDAFLELVNDVRTHSLTSNGVRAWLKGPYKRATEHGFEASTKQLALSASLSKHLEGEELLDVAEAAVEEAYVVLEGLACDPEAGVTFACESLASGLVARCEDEHGNIGWLPVRGRSLRLVDRLLALLAVDYLAQSADYDDGLCLCAACGRVEIDPISRARGTCRTHSQSGVVRLWSLPDESLFAGA